MDRVASIARPQKEIDASDLRARGPLADALRPWQYAPPAHGAEFEFYEKRRQVTISAQESGTGQEVTGEFVFGLWVDARTKMPLRANRSGPRASDAEENVFFDYAVSRLELSEVPADFFSIGKPDRPRSDKRVEDGGARGNGQMTDRQTGRSFQTYDLGLQPSLLAGPQFCLAQTDRVFDSVREPDSDPDDGEVGAPPPVPLSPEQAPHPAGPRTVGNAHYNLLTSVGSCLPGTGSLDAPDVTVSSAASASSYAAAWRAAHGADGTPDAPTGPNGEVETGTFPVRIGGQPAVAYFIDAGDDLAVFAEAGGTAVTIKGALDALQIPLLFNALEAR